MPNEPRKTIEELLQASAEARRAEFGSDPKMPNPMRARLHDEVARTAREDEPGLRRRWNWFAISWPIGTVVAAVLVVAFVLSRSHELQPPNESSRLATHQRERAKGTLRQAAPQVAAKAAAESGTKEFADVVTEPKQEAPGAAAPLPGSAAPSSASFAQNQKASSNINQQFSRNSPRAAARTSKLKDAVNVLNAFQIQQSGDQIRVVDSDGSTYTGKIETAAQDAADRILKEERENSPARTERDLSQQSNNQFYFRASGYNNSLKKAIVFEGNYIATPAQSKSPNEGAGASEQQSSARVIGTAKVTGESPIDVDATSVPQ